MGIRLGLLVRDGKVCIDDGREVATERRLPTPKGLDILGRRLGIGIHSSNATEPGAHSGPFCCPDDVIRRVVYLVGASRRDWRPQWRGEPS